ncbi:MAG: hypothetical protein K1X64_07315, partial [Myxococcaceae bacterium]|nr:hypothetical protein [Myxococcaceae bacterium]
PQVTLSASSVPRWRLWHIALAGIFATVIGMAGLLAFTAESRELPARTAEPLEFATSSDPDLSPAAAPLFNVAPAPAAVPAPAKTPVKPMKPSKTPASGTGYLTVDARPWAEVRINGKFIGETPIASFPLVAAGQAHRIELKNPETGKSTSRTVRVSNGERTFLKVDLQ